MLDLIERLEKAEIGGRELDHDISEAFHPHLIGFRLRSGFDGVSVGWAGPGWSTAWPPTYTTSLDAIVALIGEKLPGWDVVIRIPSKPTFKHVCELGAPDNTAASITDPWPFRTSAGASSAPLAACIALLRAIQTEEQRHGG
jgi:hypothetical protein